MHQVEIIPLALKKIHLRGISISWVKETALKPDQIVDGYGGRKVRQRKYELMGKSVLLRVIVDEQETKLVVITAYLASRLERYWR